ncbi:MAG TPA: hypothetical protein VGA37_15360 [Gemmatimonadales bacterium]
MALHQPSTPDHVPSRPSLSGVLVFACAAALACGNDPTGADTVRPIAGDYTLMATITTDSDSIPASPEAATAVSLDVDCDTIPFGSTPESVGVTGALTLQTVNQTYALTLITAGTACPDTPYSLTQIHSGTYVFETRLITMTPMNPLGFPSSGVTFFGEMSDTLRLTAANPIAIGQNFFFGPRLASLIWTRTPPGN